MQQHTTNDPTPWYRVPIVWLVLAIPTATVLGCLLTIVLALTHPDPVYSRTMPDDKQHVTATP